MTYEIINLGEIPNDGTGDPLRVAFTKINNNFATIASTTASGNINGSLQFISISNVGGTEIKSFLGSENLVFDTDNNSLTVGATILPLTAGNVDIGNTSAPFGNIYTNSLYIGDSVITSSDTGLDLSGSISFGDTVSYGSLVVATNSTAQAVTNTLLPNQTVYQLPLLDFTSATIDIESRVQNSQDTQKVTLSIVRKNDSTAVSHTAHNTIFLGNAITTYDVVVSSGNAMINLSPLVSGVITHNMRLTITR